MEHKTDGDGPRVRTHIAFEVDPSSLSQGPVVRHSGAMLLVRLLAGGVATGHAEQNLWRRKENATGGQLVCFGHVVGVILTMVHVRDAASFWSILRLT